MIRTILSFVVGLLSGLLGMTVGWFGLAMLVVALSAPDRDGGLAMGAFFDIGPIGGLVGFALGVAAFWKLGLSRPRKASAAQGDSAPAPTGRRLSRPYAACVLLVSAGLAYWGWWEFIRSPYLTHGDMTLDLQFRLPADMPLPQAAKDVQLQVMEGDQIAETSISDNAWHGHDGDRPVILANAYFSYKTSRRTVSLALPGHDEETWTLDLPRDPDPTPGFSPWMPSGDSSKSKIELSWRLEGE